jgi:hypothetical protein
LPYNEKIRVLKTLIVSLLFAVFFPTSGDHFKYWQSEKGLRFEIIDGYMKDLVTDIMYDRGNPLPGGIFAISFSFNCVDFEGRELGCGIYCDNQWGANRDEQYYFIPLKYEVVGENHFRLSRDGRKKIITNKYAPVEWVDNSDKMRTLIKEMCNVNGWCLSRDTEGFMGIPRWKLTRSDAPNEKVLYYNKI